MSARWRIELLGGLRAQVADLVVTRFRSQNVGTLLAYLALHSQHPQPREALTELLWPEIDPEIGRTNFRSALHSLRRELESADAAPGGLLIADRQTVRLQPDAFSTDVAELRVAVEAVARTPDPAERARLLTDAAALYRGELLPGRFEPWVLTERAALAETYLGALQQLAAAREQAGDLEGALEAARRAVAADSLREEAHYELMRLYAVAGQPSATIKQYHELERILREEVGQTPSAATRALAEELLQSARTVVVARSGRADGKRKEAVSIQPPPPLPIAPSPPRLPVQFTRFFGREEEIARLTELLRIPETRLVTLTGPGGSGKTRLAIAVAGRLQEEFQQGDGSEAIRPLSGHPGARSGGPWLVPLAEVSDGRRLVEALWQALHLPHAPGLEPLEQVIAALQPHRSLLVLDNFEQLAEQGAPLVLLLLSRLPALTCLVTSRQRLDLAGEQEFMVLPLPTPRVGDFGFRISDFGLPAQSKALEEQASSSGATPPMNPEDRASLSDPIQNPKSKIQNPEALMQYPSVQLFVDRAQAARPGFQLTAANAAAVAELCDRLEGLPLALELAAARAAVLTPEQILPRLTRRFELLVSHERSRSARHRSLRAAIDWSYQQLPVDLQRFFDSLSVFRGGFDLEAATALMDSGSEAPDGGVTPGADAVPKPFRPSDTAGNETLEHLELLRQCSLLVAEEAGPGMRYRLLESLRQYGQEQLTAEQQAALSRRHAAFFVHWAERAEAEGPGDETLGWEERLKQEQENLRAALSWCFGTETETPSDVEPPGHDVSSGEQRVAAAIGLRLAAALPWLWLHQGQLREGRGWLERALARAGHAPARLRARLLLGVGQLGIPEGNFQTARGFIEQSLTLFREVDDPLGTATALECLGWVAYGGKEGARTRTLWEESLGLRRRLNRRAEQLHLLRDLVWLTADLGDRVASRAFYEERLALMSELGGASAAAARLIRAGEAAREQGSLAVVREIRADAMAVGSEFGSRSELADALEHLGEIARDLGDYALARDLLQQVLAMNRALGRLITVHLVLFFLSQVSRLLGELSAARACIEESLQIARATGGKEPIAHSLDELRLVALKQGDWQTARTLPRESLVLWQEMGNLWGLAEALEGAAHVAIAAGETEYPPENRMRATRLFGAAARLRETIGRAHHSHERADYERSLAAARAALGEDAFAAAWAEGRELSLDQAVALAAEP